MMIKWNCLPFQIAHNLSLRVCGKNSPDLFSISLVLSQISVFFDISGMSLISRFVIIIFHFTSYRERHTQTNRKESYKTVI
jgi:hypothetical protein